MLVTDFGADESRHQHQVFDIKVPEDRAVVSYEQNLFYRHLIHAFGAPGLAMIRIVKSDDDELEDIAEDFLLFHDEIPEEESLNVKISFEVTPTLDANSKFKLK